MKYGERGPQSGKPEIAKKPAARPAVLDGRLTGAEGVVDDGCGRYVLQVKAKDLAKRYNVAKTPDGIRENFNVAPGQSLPVVIEPQEGGRRIEMMRWGLVPVWAKDPKIGYKLINARDDTIFDKPMWRGAVLKKRALIPATGFYEWQMPSGPKARKQPFYIHPKRTGIFSFAGVWSNWTDAEGKEWHTYSIITTEPNKEMAKVHNRMPVILDSAGEDAWLDPAKTARQDIEPFLRPYHDGGLEIYRVSDEVNSPANNDKHLIQPAA
jgi:putative SOS response-associated peptidase YedK